MCYYHEASSYEETATTPLIWWPWCPEYITASSKHSSILEFQVKGLITLCIWDDGCKPAGENFDSDPTDVKLCLPSVELEFELSPGVFVYDTVTGKNVNLIMTFCDRNTSQVEIVGVCIALSPKYKETEETFFATTHNWDAMWGTKNVKRKFVWILETIPPEKKRVEHVKASRGPGDELLSPEHDIVYATIGEISRVAIN